MRSAEFGIRNEFEIRIEFGIRNSEIRSDSEFARPEFETNLSGKFGLPTETYSWIPVMRTVV